MSPVPMVASTGLESRIVDFSPFVGEHDYNSFLETARTQTRAAAEMYWQATTLPLRVATEFARELGRNLEMNRLLGSLKSKEGGFEVTRELNRAVYGAIGDANPIHHQKRSPIVGYGTTLGFEFLLLRSDLPREQLLSMEAKYSVKMMEGDEVKVKYTQASHEGEGVYKLVGVATNKGGEEIAQYTYLLRFADEPPKMPSNISASGLSNVPKVALPWYNETRLKKRANQVQANSIPVNDASLSRMVKVFQLLSGGKGELGPILENRDLAEIYISGLISKSMADLGGKGTLFSANNIIFHDQIAYGDAPHLNLQIIEVAPNKKGDHWKLYYAGDVQTHNGRIATVSPFGLRPIQK